MKTTATALLFAGACSALNPLKARRSVAKYSDKAVPADATTKALEAAIQAPNHFLSEPWRFYTAGQMRCTSHVSRPRRPAWPSSHWLMCTQVANYCLCQRCWPFGHAKSPFKTKEDYMDALLAHHAVMTAAMKAKQAVEPSASAALKHAVEDAVKMYVPL